MIVTPGRLSWAACASGSTPAVLVPRVRRRWIPPSSSGWTSREGPAREALAQPPASEYFRRQCWPASSPRSGVRRARHWLGPIALWASDYPPEFHPRSWGAAWAIKPLPDDAEQILGERDRRLQAPAVRTTSICPHERVHRSDRRRAGCAGPCGGGAARPFAVACGRRYRRAARRPPADDRDRHRRQRRRTSTRRSRRASPGLPPTTHGASVEWPSAGVGDAAGRADRSRRVRCRCTSP
jgi:hypothetical protein